MKRKCLILFSCILFLINCKKHDDVPNNPVTPTTNPTVESKVPKLSTKPISELTLYSVTVGGCIIDTVGSNLTEQGVVVGTSSLPTLSNNLNKFSLKVDILGNFGTTIVNIPANTTYYLRAYGINTQGVGYGNEISFTSLKEKVYNGNVTIYTQQELNEFGANNYTTIKGSLYIWGGVTDLTPLNSLVIIGNGFEVKNTSLIDFKGLENLEIVGVDFIHSVRIENNQSLKNFLGLNKLKITQGYFYVLNNDALVDLKGLDSYTTCANGEFRIQDCDNLQSITGLENMQYIYGSIYLMNNRLLNDLTAWKNLKKISEGIYVINNKSLTSINGFDNINQVEGIDLIDNPILTDLKGFHNISSIKGINIRNNNLLSDLSSFNKITSVQYLSIESSNSITDLKGFCNLQDIGVELHIYHNPKLIDLTGLEKLNSLNRLYIHSNESLLSLKGLNNLNKIITNSYSITIGYNKNLKSLIGLNNLSQVDGYIQIFNNALLTDFCPLKFLFTKGNNSDLNFSNNAINPSRDEIINNCP